MTWQEQLPDTLVVEHEGKQVPLRDVPLIKETPDVPTLAKRLYDSQTEMGRRVRIPAKTDKPEVTAEFKKKVYESGVFEAPPEKPEAYAFDGLDLDEDLSGKFRVKAHELGLSATQAKSLAEFHTKMMEEAGAQYEVTKEEATQALKSKWGDAYDQKYELATRAMNVLFKDEKSLAFFEQTKLGNHPILIETLAAFGERMAEDGTITPKADATAIDAEYQAAMDILSGKNKEEYEKYKKELPEGPIHQKIEAAFKKKYPGKHMATVGGDWMKERA